MGIGDDLKKGLDKGFGYIGALGKADPQVISLVKVRFNEQHKWNDVFSTKLIELLARSKSLDFGLRSVVASSTGPRH